MRELTRWTDQYPTLTFGVSVTSDNIAALRGKSWRVRIPFQSQFLDDRPGIPALFGGFLTTNTGNIDGVSVDNVQAVGIVTALNGAFDPRAQIFDAIELQLSVAADADAFGPVPLVIIGMAPADEAKTAVAATYATNDNIFIVTDRNGGSVECYAVEI